MGQTDILGLAASRLDWLDDRQRVLARNIANSDTPGYVPRDEQPFGKSLAALQVEPLIPRAPSPCGRVNGRSTATRSPSTRR